MKRIIAAALLAWATVASAGEMRRVVSDYEITPNQGSGIVRAFYYGPTTVIEFEAPPGSFSAVDQNGNPIEFEPEGRFVRLVDRPSIFTISFAGRAATFRSREEAAKIKPKVVAAGEAGSESDLPFTSNTAPAPAPAWAQPAPVAHLNGGEAETAGEAKESSGPVETWEVLATDQWLSQTVKRWGAKAGWGVSWETRDFPIGEFKPSYHTTFEDAVFQLVLGVSESDAPVMADFRDDGKNKIVRIIKFGGNSNVAHQK